MRKIIMPSVVLVALLTSQQSTDATRARSIVDLGGLPGEDSYARAINDSGQIAGIAAFQKPGQRAIEWSGGRVMTLPPLPGDVASEAYAINNRGQVVGASVRVDNTREPAMWDRGRVIDLGMLPNGVTGEAYDINDRGEIVGNVMLYDVTLSGIGEVRAFVWRNGVISDLGSEFVLASDGFSEALGINNRGQIVGTIGFGHPYIWDHGKTTLLGSLGGPSGIAVRINDRGDVVGGSFTKSNLEHAFIWRQGKMIDIGVLPGGDNSIALGVNERGEVVGQSEPGGRAYVWRSGTMVDLGFLGLAFSRAEAINDRGDIVGLAINTNSENRAVLWTATPQR